MRHFEMAYATLYTETLILYTFWLHDQPHFVYESLYFDMYLRNLSMDTWTLIYICVICIWIHVFWYIFVIYVDNDIHINLISNIIQFIVDHVYCSYLWNIIHFDHVVFDSNAIICEEHFNNLYYQIWMQCIIWSAIMT